MSPLEQFYAYIVPLLKISGAFVADNIVWIFRLILAACVAAFVSHFIFDWIGI